MTPIRWLVDGMNLIGSKPDKWWNDPDKAMRAMASMLDRYAASTGEEVTVVFDKDPGSLPELEHARVQIARWKGRNAADHEIEELVAADDDPRGLKIVSSDKRLVEKVKALGAGVVSSGSFRKTLERVAGAR